MSLDPCFSSTFVLSLLYLFLGVIYPGYQKTTQTVSWITLVRTSLWEINATCSWYFYLSHLAESFQNSLFILPGFPPTPPISLPNYLCSIYPISVWGKWHFCKTVTEHGHWNVCIGLLFPLEPIRKKNKHLGAILALGFSVLWGE